jgi:hypothetical protein
VVLADRGYDHDKYRRLVWDLGVKPLIARRGTEHGSGLGTQRWVVERAFAHLHWFRRLRIRWGIRDDIHEAFLTLGCALICWRRLRSLRGGLGGGAFGFLGSHDLIAMLEGPCSDSVDGCQQTPAQGSESVLNAWWGSRVCLPVHQSVGLQAPQRLGEDLGADPPDLLA